MLKIFVTFSKPIFINILKILTQCGHVFKKHLLLTIEDNVPTKMTSSQSTAPWVTAQTKRLIRRKNSWYKRAKKRDNPKTWRKYREIKQLTQKLCRKSHDSYIRDLISDNRCTKRFWSYVKSQRTENAGISDLVDKNRTISARKKKPTFLMNNFRKFFPNPVTQPTPPLLFRIVQK